MRSVIAVLVISLLSCSCTRSTTSAQAPAATAIVDVVELSAVDALQRMATGTLTSRELTQAYLDRIAALDDAGPRLNAVIDVNPAALVDAEALDTERQSGRLRGALHGIPILLKDNIDVVGMVNSAGSLALADNRPHQDAFVVARLRAAGRRPRQDESERMGKLPFDAVHIRLELARRANQESLCAGSEPMRVECRYRCGDFREFRGDWRRHRDRREHHLSRCRQRSGRSQAYCRGRQPAWDYPDFNLARHRRTNGPYGGRSSAADERHGSR